MIHFIICHSLICYDRYHYFLSSSSIIINLDDNNDCHHLPQHHHQIRLYWNNHHKDYIVMCQLSNMSLDDSIHKYGSKN
ncbi:hypothetical protein DERF_003966 [Dermatophagoides farinae]|uniref:Uncharacterized protein n=1 Tax=Dermatophagoides farinae TaxID=6954 RepID=A0A922LBX6_DERFA|nr:hypothetical protein DERF_003966 [Dermatophagoides farinae]